jgi:hypothetical protein
LRVSAQGGGKQKHAKERGFHVISGGNQFSEHSHFGSEGNANLE